MATSKRSQTRQALAALLEFTVSGRRYRTQNPYTIPEVREAFRALGLDMYGSSDDLRRIVKGASRRDTAEQRDSTNIRRRQIRRRRARA